MKNEKLKYMFVFSFVLFTNIHSQGYSLNADLTFNTSNKIYSDYTGFSLGFNFPFVYEDLYIEPYIKIFKTEINFYSDQIPENSFNKGITFGAKVNYFPTEIFYIETIKYQPYMGFGFGYQLNFISETSNFPIDLNNEIFFNELEKDFVTDLFAGIVFTPKPGFLQLSAEFTYQLRNPVLSYHSDAAGENIFHRRKVNLNALLGSIGIRVIF